MGNKTGKLVLILEKSNASLTVDDRKNYILEGIFAEFGKENRNNRIYEEEEYLPHLEELQEKIRKSGGFMGELDHPESFDVLAKNASHLIEHLEYDKKTRQVRGRIRLLSTTMGKEARALIDDGVQLAISSRAAGLVGENKHVQIKKIFTYDIVADPGFENAQLSRVDENTNLIGLNESLGLDADANIQIFDMSNVTNKRQDNIRPYNNTKNTEKGMANNRITLEQIDAYSRRVLKPEFDRINKAIDSIKNTRSVPDNSVAEKFNQMKTYFNYLTEKLNQTVNYCEHIAKNANTVDRVDIKQINKNIDDLTKYTKYVSGKLDESIEFSDYISNNLSNVSEYADYLGEGLNKSIKYSSEHLAEKLDAAIQYNEYVKEQVKNSINYAEYLGEKINSNINENRRTRTNKRDENLNENRSDIYTRHRRANGDINSKVDAVLESVRKNKVETVTNEMNYRFLSILNDAKKNEFLALDETKKQKVAKALSESICLSERDIVRVWENALRSFKDPQTRWLAEMPRDLKPIWEAADPATKDRITAHAALYLNESSSSYGIQKFWENCGLKKSQPLELLTESQPAVASVDVPKTNSLGYNDAYLMAMQEGIRNRFKK